MIKLAASSLSFCGTHHEVATLTKTERPQSTPQGRPINHHVVTTTPGDHRPRYARAPTEPTPAPTHTTGGLDTHPTFR
jgi:hypothetical protein